MSEFYLRSIDRRWKKEIAFAEEAVIFLSPYLTSNTANLVLQNADARFTRVYTVFSFQNFASGGSSIKTLRQLQNKGLQLFHLERLHAKVLIVDKKFASVGSQNLTFGGTRNKEASVVILDVEQISRLKELVESWIVDAMPISEVMITKAENLIEPLQEKIKLVTDEIADTEEQYWFELRLDEIQKHVPKIRQRLQHFSKTAGIRSVDEATAKLFIRESVWWLTHSSGWPVRAPGFQNRVYGSSPDWKVDFGANTFLVGRAIQRCLNTIEDAVERINKGENVSYEETWSKMSYNIRGAVANYSGYEYEGYYSAIGAYGMIFGAQSINISDFIQCAMRLTDFKSIFVKL